MTSAATGTQSIQRTIDILQAMATLDEGSGVRIIDLCSHMQLGRPTVHRILGCLERNAMVSRMPSRRYALGPGVRYLGLAAASRYDLPDLCAGPLASLAERTGDTVFLTLRSGADCVTVSRYEGHYPVKTLTLSVGARRPLTVGAGAMAILASLDDEERQAILAQHEHSLGQYTDFSVDTLRVLLMEARQRGYVVNIGHTTPEVTAVGMAICNRKGVALAAISVAAISVRMNAARIASIVDNINEAMQEIHAELDRLSLG